MGCLKCTFFIKYMIHLLRIFPKSEKPLSVSCGVRVVKEMDLKSIGLCPHRFESCLQREYSYDIFKINEIFCILIFVNISDI